MYAVIYTKVLYFWGRRHVPRSFRVDVKTIATAGRASKGLAPLTVLERWGELVLMCKPESIEYIISSF